MGVHINFVRAIPQDLQCLPRISAMCVVEDVSTRLDIVTGCCVGSTASFDKDVGDVGVAELEEPVDRPRTTIST